VSLLSTGKFKYEEFWSRFNLTSETKKESRENDKVKYSPSSSVGSF